MLNQWLEKLWYQANHKYWLLWPLSLVYRLVAWLRKRCLVRFFQHLPHVPVVVIGNISVGGTGKTPLLIALGHALQRKGLKVGVVSRGYQSCAPYYPYRVRETDSALQVGDEPYLIAMRLNCPVVIAPNRVAAVDYLLAENDVDIILSDDGLQHYRMGRHIEIAVVDSIRAFGNGCCLPAGPLREPRARLKEVDFLVYHGKPEGFSHKMTLAHGAFKRVQTNESVEALPKGSIAAVAGIGYPQRFFRLLHTLGIEHTAYVFPDHHRFEANDLSLPQDIVVMTEKDAVKCRNFTHNNAYYLPVDACLSDSFWQEFWSHAVIKTCLSSR